MAQRLGQSQALKATQTQRQALSLTPQLAQSIRMLAMSQAELDAAVSEEVGRNPFLRVESRPRSSVLLAPRLPSHSLADGRVEDVWDRIAAPVSLPEHLRLQIAQRGAPANIARTAGEIVDDLTEAGRLPDPEDCAQRIGAPPRDFAEALRLVHSLEPAGMGARDLRHCLELQLRAQDRFDPAIRSILDRLDLVANGNRTALRRVSGLEADDLDDALAELQALDPLPGLRFAPSAAAVAPPDILMRTDERGGWHVELNPETLPRVLLDESYHAHVIPRLRNSVEQAFVASALQDAHWLVRSLDQRARTIVKVMSAIASLQDAYFSVGTVALRPLTMREVAAAIGMHESTVSRVSSNKTVLSPQGVRPLKFFFSTSIPGRSGHAHSAAAVRDRIRSLVAEEGRAVLSDDALVARLREDGVEIARRTVAKYRDGLAIPSSVQRRRLLATRSDRGRIAAPLRV